MKEKICPNCGSNLSKKPEHAQGVFYCKSCEGIFFILYLNQIKGSKFVETKPHNK